MNERTQMKPFIPWQGFSTTMFVVADITQQIIHVNDNDLVIIFQPGKSLLLDVRAPIHGPIMSNVPHERYQPACWIRSCSELRTDVSFNRVHKNPKIHSDSVFTVAILPGHHWLARSGNVQHHAHPKIFPTHLVFGVVPKESTSVTINVVMLRLDTTIRRANDRRDTVQENTVTPVIPACRNVTIIFRPGARNPVPTFCRQLSFPMMASWFAVARSIFQSSFVAVSNQTCRCRLVWKLDLALCENRFFSSPTHVGAQHDSHAQVSLVALT